MSFIRKIQDMKPYFFNQSNIVSQAIDGNLSVSCGKLARANQHKIVVRSDYESNRDKVAIISGGGAGHEPMHIGFVGRGMLDASVCGETFASPSVNAILSAILLVTGDPGCLLIVKNYTGDRLNFAIAAERARAMGKRVEIVIVADDIAISNPDKRRGIAGTIFLHKLAGHYAEQGFSLLEIKNKCSQAAKNLFSLSLSIMAADSLSGSELAEYAPQLGRGIHNEAGTPLLNFNTQDMAKKAVKIVMDGLVAKTDDHSLYTILINNLGGLTPLAMSNITSEILDSPFKERIKYVVGPGSFCTSLNMRGFSLTLLALNDDIEQALLSEVEPRAWVQPVIPFQPQLIDVTTHLELSQEYIPSENQRNRHIIKKICDTVISNRDQLNALDARAGDGDAGTTLATIATQVKEELDNLPLNNPAHLFLAISELLESVGGGTSGVLLSLLFLHTGNGIEDSLNLAPALKEAVDTMAKYAGSQTGDRSMLDALIPVIEALENEESLQVAAKAARNGADLTSSMEARVGRAANVSWEVYKGFNDSGAEAVALIFECLAETMA